MLMKNINIVDANNTSIPHDDNIPNRNEEAEPESPCCENRMKLPGAKTQTTVPTNKPSKRALSAKHIFFIKIIK